MKNFRKKFMSGLIIILTLFSINFSYSQCNLTYYAGIFVPTSGTAFVTWTPYGPGQYFALPVLNGGSYAVSTCGASIDTQLTGWDPSAASVVFFNDDAGPLCAGANASVDNYVPNFTNYMYVQVTEANCLPGGTSSINLYLRQNDNLNFTSSSAAMCSGQTRNLTATPVNIGASPGGYGNPGTFSGTGVSGGVFTAPSVVSPTNYTITYTFGYVTHNQVITVNPLPVVGASVTNSVICNGATTTLNGSGANTYTWTGGATNGVAFSPSVTLTYTVTGTSTAGCTSTNSAVQTITVNALPSLTANVTNSIICNGATTTLFGSGANTYTWSGGVTNNVAFSPTVTASYTVTGTSTAGCTGTNSAVKSITVNAVPVVTANVTNSVICNGATTTLNGAGATTYTWTGGVTNGVAFSPSVTASYTLTGSTAGCTSTNSAVQSVTVNPLPAVGASVTNSVICNGATTTLNGSGANTYTWTGGVTNGVAFSPSVTLTYTVTGTSTAGCTSTNSAVQTITVNALPSLTANVTNSIICNGATTTLFGSGANTYTWTGGVTNNVAFSPTVTASYTVTGTSTAGCTGTNSAVKSITVNAVPVVTANVTNSVICNGATTTLNGAGATTYTWTGGVTNGVAFSPSVTASYTLTGSTAGCTSTNSAVQSVTVNPLPVVGASVTNSVICNGATTTLNGSGANTYTWSGGVANGVAFSPSVTLTYTVTGTSTAGCTSTNSAVQTVTVNSNPTISVNSGSICSGDSFTMVPSGANTYTFEGGNAVVSPTTNTSYTVVGTSTNGCVSQTFTTSNVIVNAIPTISVNSGSICSGDSFTMVPSGANTYTFEGGSAIVSPTSNVSYTVVGTSTAGCISSTFATSSITVNLNPTITVNSGSICLGNSFTMVPSGANTYTFEGGSAVVNPSVNATYTVIGTSTAGCLSTAFVTSSVTVDASPLPTITVNSGSICAGDSFTIIPSGANTYTFEGGSAVVNPTATANYTVVGTNTAGCISQTFATSSVSVNALPSLSITGSSTICAREFVILTANGADTYSWNVGANTSTISVGPLVTTTYTAIGSSSLTGCAATSTFEVVVTDCTGLANLTAASGISVYPNPNTGIFTIELNASTHIVISNALGQEILNETMTSGKHDINIQNQVKGVYFVRIKGQNINQTIKLISE